MKPLTLRYYGTSRYLKAYSGPTCKRGAKKTKARYEEDKTIKIIPVTGAGLVILEQKFVGESHHPNFYHLALFFSDNSIGGLGKIRIDY